MNKISVSQLFDVEDLWFKEIFDGVFYPWEVLSNIRFFIDKCPKEMFIEYSKGVFVASGTRIHPSAVIEAPCIIGADTEIRPSAYIRGNVITGKKCVIGNSTEVKNSILMNNVQVPHYNYVGDSVLGNFSHMGAGSVCSNLKADGSDVVVHDCEDIYTGLRKLGAVLADRADVGCNCVLNPGTVIGKNTVVYPSVSVRGVIPPNSIVKAQSIIVEKY